MIRPLSKYYGMKRKRSKIGYTIIRPLWSGLVTILCHSQKVTFLVSNSFSRWYSLRFQVLTWVLYLYKNIFLTFFLYILYKKRKSLHLPTKLYIYTHTVTLIIILRSPLLSLFLLPLPSLNILVDMSTRKLKFPKDEIHTRL